MLLADAARRETPRLAALMERLRDVDRAGTRRDSEFDAAGLAELAEGFRDRGVNLVVEVPPPGLRLRADKQMLSRAIENLLSNAVDASPAGATVRLTITGRGDELEIAVEDQGAGVAGSVRDKMFRGFASTKEGGLGLGLTVVRQVVEAHGGTVSIEQPSAGGSRFALRVPLRPPPRT
jgi:signal transduction histidine kinase